MRITPRITPHVPNPRNISPKNLARSAPRAALTGNFPHPRIGGAKLPKVPGASTAKAKLASLTTGAHTGRARKPNAKPKTTTGLKTQPSYRARRPPNSMSAQRPGVRTIKGAKMKVNRANPLRVRKIHF